MREVVMYYLQKSGVYLHGVFWIGKAKRMVLSRPMSML